MGPCVRRDDGRVSFASNDQIAEIAPLQIFALDQLDLPVALPALELLFTGNRFIRPFERLDIDQSVNTVGFDER